MSANDNELLRRYLRNRSEADFAELVGRHLGLVYAAALRQVNGDTHAAEDVAQAVFVDLARKAPSLLRHTSLTGWLYTSTRYLAANARRAASRRLVHEQAAQIMNELALPETAEPDWTSLRPVLDEAMHDLLDADREAVLWRYFEKHPFAVIGARLGLNENAARMRVERALEKLRGALAKRGVTSAAAALALLLANQGVGAVPLGLAQRVCQASMAVPVAGGVGALLAAWLGSARIKFALGAAIAVGFGGLVLLLRSSPDATASNAAAVTAASGELSNSPALVEQRPAVQLRSVNPSVTAEAAATNGVLELRLVAADSNDPAANANIECYWSDGDQSDWEKAHSDSAGVAVIPLKTNLVELELYVRVEGFVSMLVGWRPPRGENIPAQYVLKLARAATLGGRVLDAEGAPVAGAKVQAHARSDKLGESHRETPLGSFEVTTDASGRWQSRAVAPEMVRELQLEAHHPERGSSESVNVQADVETEGLLRSGKHALHLRPVNVVSGRVLNPDRQPVAGVEVLLGELYTTDSKKTKSGRDGTFAFRGVPRGKRLLTATASGFAPMSLRIDAQPDAASVELVLNVGRPLEIRVVDLAGQPLAGVEVSLRASHELNNRAGSAERTNEVIPQFVAHKKTDANGKTIFEHAPVIRLEAGTDAPGFVCLCGHQIQPEENEAVLRLGPELTVGGTVKDSAGQAVPRFTMTIGEMTSHGFDWSGIDRFQLSFQGGVFRHVLKEALNCSGTNAGYWLKFETDGFAPFVSRFIAPDEAQVKLEVTLSPAAWRELTILNPDGTPAASADVGLLDMAQTSGNAIPLVPGGIGRAYGRTDGAVLRADAEGRVKFPPEGVHRIVVASPVGYARLDLGFVVEDRIRLEPWGRIEGTLPVGTNGSAHVEVLFEVGNQPGLMADFFSGYRLQAGADGKFVLPLVPPGQHRVIELIPTTADPEARTHTWAHGRAATVEIHPGATEQVTLVETKR